jgi:hypothetical protein
MGIIVQTLHYNVGIITPMHFFRTTMQNLLSIAFCAALHSNHSDAMQYSIHFNEDILHAMQVIQYNAYPSPWNAFHHDNA